MIIKYEGGTKFSASIREHTIYVDQPTTTPGGEDSAPMPIELVGAALGTCVGYYVYKFCEARTLASEGLSVEVDYHKTQGRIGGFDVRVVLPEGFPAQYVELVERVVRTCPVHNTLTNPADINVLVTIPEGERTFRG